MINLIIKYDSLIIQEDVRTHRSERHQHGQQHLENARLNVRIRSLTVQTVRSEKCQLRDARCQEKERLEKQTLHGHT